ncbi:MAG: hypothetical protein Q9169_008306 [Polycauliona sp. 2 TL-2023]
MTATALRPESYAGAHEYFSDTIGPVRRVHLTYGPNGVMRGIVTIVFVRPESAAKALETLNGVQVDKRPMKVLHHTDNQLLPDLL